MKTSTSSNPTSTRRVPQRTCITCRTVRAKRELIRLVRIPSGNIEVDITGRMPGRGAYLCRSCKCWEAGLKGKRLEYILRCTLTPENRELLASYAKDLQEGA